MGAVLANAFILTFVGDSSTSSSSSSSSSDSSDAASETARPRFLGEGDGVWSALIPATRSGDENTSASVSFAERKIGMCVLVLDMGCEADVEVVEDLTGEG